MERTLFNKNGEPVAYITDDYHETIYLWDGSPVAYLHEDQHIYGINGRHLGWFIDEILFNGVGKRIGFTARSCPGSIVKEPIKPEKFPRDEIQSRWKTPSLPKLGFDFADQDLKEFLKEGEAFRSIGGQSSEPQKENDQN